LEPILTAPDIQSRPFAPVTDLVAETAAADPHRAALHEAGRSMTYGELDALMDRIAAALQRDGVENGDVVAMCAATCLESAAVFLGAVRAGAAIAPLPASVTPDTLAMMLADCGAKAVFLDAAARTVLAPVADRVTARRLALDSADGGDAFEAWLAPAGSKPAPAEIRPEQAFNIIYSSGTTGSPKGIVQPHAMRWANVQRSVYPPGTVTLISTPLYSNTSLVSFLPTIALGGAAVLMPKFDAEGFLALSQRFRVTQAMLVPVQYRRILAHPDFDAFDLTSYRVKFCTSAPFAAELKAEVLRRWPGGLVEYYGMTEGGVSCSLSAHKHPDKLHTVGRPLPGHELRLIDEEGREVAAGEVGEVVGRSGAMMKAYHNQPAKTAEAEWWSPDGKRFIRSGDVGRLDEDGFLILMDRRKDMIISGGFNIYPSDLEAVLAQHEAVLEAAVVGAPSEAWGETPVAFVALKPGAAAEAGTLRAWANARLGKTQRLADLRLVEALPRSAIGKVLKRELRDGYGPQPAAAADGAMA
jgi:acyl-CoA synthetase (AMP-forming)/AMP-acid ligase II